MKLHIAPLTAAGLILLSCIDAWLLVLLMREEEMQAQQVLAENASSAVLLSATITPTR
jgi:hypothetical protein